MADDNVRRCASGTIMGRELSAHYLDSFRISLSSARESSIVTSKGRAISILSEVTHAFHRNSPIFCYLFLPYLFLPRRKPGGEDGDRQGDSSDEAGRARHPSLNLQGRAGKACRADERLEAAGDGEQHYRGGCACGEAGEQLGGLADSGLVLVRRRLIQAAEGVDGGVVLLPELVGLLAVCAHVALGRPVDGALELCGHGRHAVEADARLVLLLLYSVDAARDRPQGFVEVAECVRHAALGRRPRLAARLGHGTSDLNVCSDQGLELLACP